MASTPDPPCNRPEVTALLSIHETQVSVAADTRAAMNGRSQNHRQVLRKPHGSGGNNCNGRQNTTMG
ncbi:hypothetical protein CSAL01_13195 [Colletotrichum salicis]|uniref:Uncharacterized protein n=1 Tax=Colletotrichum salicis TaxID=1209931 RepID=A0A135UP31_9PEZI|nr:hypothetical protein CSAL01_13195 [Colletotrichum salicis]